MYTASTASSSRILNTRGYRSTPTLFQNLGTFVNVNVWMESCDHPIAANALSSEQ